MIRRTLRYLLGVLGYLAWTLLVLLVSLWVMFPADSLKNWLEGQLETRLKGTAAAGIESLRLTMAPGLEVTKIQILTRDRSQPLATVDRLDISARIPALLKGEPVLSWRMSLAGGDVRGTVSLDNGPLVRITGKGQNIALERAIRLDLLAGREATGILAVEGECRGRPFDPGTIRCSGSFVLKEGIIPLRRKLLGMDRIQYSRISGHLVLDGGTLHLTDGQAESRQLSAAFKGEATVRLPLSATRIQAEGTLKPRPELLLSSGRGPGAAMIRELASRQGLPFLLNGTLAEPGLKLAGRSLASWERIGRQW